MGYYRREHVKPKKISSLETVTPVVMYHMLNSGNHATILSEIRPILIEARYNADTEEWVNKDNGRGIPEMGIRLSVPTNTRTRHNSLQQLATIYATPPKLSTYIMCSGRS